METQYEEAHGRLRAEQVQLEAALHEQTRLLGGPSPSSVPPLTTRPSSRRATRRGAISSHDFHFRSGVGGGHPSRGLDAAERKPGAMPNSPKSCELEAVSASRESLARRELGYKRH